VIDLTAIVASMAGGLGTGLGTAAADRVNQVARDRLGSSDPGRTALARLDAPNPPPDARENVLAQLRAAIENDPEFAQRLRHAADPNTRPTSSHVVTTAGRDITTNTFTASGRTRVKTLAFGPVTVRDTPGVRRGLVALVVVLTLSLAFGTLAVVRMLRSDGGRPVWWSAPGAPGDSSERTTATAQDTPRKSEPTTRQGGTREKTVAAIRDQGRFEAILPNLRSMPTGWSLDPNGTMNTCAEKDPSGNCDKGALFYKTVRFNDSNTLARFRVSAYESAAAATEGYINLVKIVRGLPDTVLTDMSLAPVGDESVALSAEDNTESIPNQFMVAIVRVGTVVARLDYGGAYKTPDADTLLTLTTMVAERAQQAQNGDTPTATARK
jgi:hypothetical protein